MVNKTKSRVKQDKMLNFENIRQELVIILGIAVEKIGDVAFPIVQDQFDSNISTNLDYEIDAFLTERLQKLYNCPVISEETFSKYQNIKNDYVWVIDPIDGTLNLLAGIKNFAISAALLDAKTLTPLVASVAILSQNIVLSATKGRGSFLNDLPLSLDTPHYYKPDIVSIGLPGDAHLLADEIANKIKWLIEEKWIIRQSGAAALDICFTALKNWKGFWEQNLYLWDFAAAELIAAESGCHIHKKVRDRNLLRYDLLVTISDEVSNKLLNVLLA